MNKQIFITELTAKFWKLARFLIIVGLSFVLIYPILYMVSMSLRTADQVADPSVIWIPKYYTLSNFVDAVKFMNYSDSFHTSMTVTLTSSILSLISCSMAGYGFARFKFRSKGIWFTFVLLTLIVPAQAVTIPLYLQYQEFSIPIISPILNIFFNVQMPSWLTVSLIDSWLVFRPEVQLLEECIPPVLPFHTARIGGGCTGRRCGLFQDLLPYNDTKRGQRILNSFHFLTRLVLERYFLFKRFH